MNIPSINDINGKTVVITGGAGVLCSMFAEVLAECGAKIAILDLDENKAAEVTDRIVGKGGRAISLKTNVLDKADIEASHNKILEEFGPCDILINGAGGNSPRATTDDEFYDEAVFDAPDKKSFFDLDPEGVSFVFGLNFNGTLLPTQVFARDMIGRNGVILNVSSMNSFTPLTKIPAYSAAKAAISNFTQWLATYFSKCGIRVNAIAPGFFATAQNEMLLFNQDGTLTARSDKILRNTPMGRFGVPEDLIGTLLYLLSNDFSSFVTGVVVPVDGGFAAYSGV